ncbi:MAG: hypothetical protein B7Y99_10845 [Caulobacterales bacterium 32-69-10]|nr:MAG: hypothetical protein B7Y99_10845 [Caulobacterales bacterium 32-69-10]
MTSVLEWLFGTARFVPHGVCLLWRADLVALHVVSDIVIALSYFAIPGVIWWFVRRRPDLEPAHRRMAVLFALFITACGLTHVAGVVTLWFPYYGLQALLKGLTAVVSLVTACALPFVAPKLLRIPSPRALAAVNDRLQQEVVAHQATLAALETAHADLEHKVAEQVEDIRVLNSRLAAGLLNSPVTLVEQDEDLHYTWLFNPPKGVDAEALVGHVAADIVDEEAAAAVESLRRDALKAGEVREGEIRAQVNGEELWFLVRAQPTRLRDGRAGLVTSSTNITPQKRHQEHLRLITRELNHRSKNLLTIVQSIARQTAAGLDVPAAFLERLGERLGSLAAAHDVLVDGAWRSADLRAVIEGQLKHHMQTFGDRIDLAGEKIELAPEMAHYVGLAVHELGSNAVKHGALATPGGRIEVTWRAEPAGDGGRTLRLDWRESGAPAKPPPTVRGFGRTILEVLTPRAMAGEAQLNFAEAGVSWSLSAPLAA